MVVTGMATVLDFATWQQTVTQFFCFNIFVVNNPISCSDVLHFLSWYPTPTISSKVTMVMT